jgi:BTG family
VQSIILTMEKEVLFASYFLVFFIRSKLRRGQLLELERLKLKSELVRLMKTKTEECCIKFEGDLDPMFAQACKNANLCTNWMHWKFLDGLTIWINPTTIKIKSTEKDDVFILDTSKMKTFDNDHPAPWPILQGLIYFNRWRIKRSHKIKRLKNK